MIAAQHATLRDATWVAAWSSTAPSLRRVARRLTRDDDEAEDLLQETAVRAHRFAAQFRAGTSASAWLHRILRNAFASRYRKRRREREVIERARVEGALPEPRTRDGDEPHIVAASLSDEVAKALAALHPEFRAVLTLVIVDGLSYREAADALGCPIGTVMSRLHRARAAMLAQLHGARGRAPAAPVAARRKNRARAQKTELFGGVVTRRAA